MCCFRIEIPFLFPFRIPTLRLLRMYSLLTVVRDSLSAAHDCWCRKRVKRLDVFRFAQGHTARLSEAPIAVHLLLIPDPI